MDDMLVQTARDFDGEKLMRGSSPAIGTTPMTPAIFDAMFGD